MRPTEKEIEQKFREIRQNLYPAEVIVLDVANWAMNRAVEGMMPIPEVVGFEEFYETPTPQGYFEWNAKKQWEYIWTASQAALIASGRVIEVPKVEEWPDNAVAFNSGFVSSSGKWIDDSNLSSIKRPAPAWTPKPNDPVFLNPKESHKPIYVGRVIEVFDGGVTAIYGRGDQCWWEMKRVKPFDSSKLGKKWEEV